MPTVKDASGVGTDVPPDGAATYTRSPESTDLMSKVSRGILAWSLITPRKNGLSFVPWSSHWIQLEV